MKQVLLLVLLAASINCYAQRASEEQAVQEVINQFFQSLEKRDTILFKRVSAMEGQVWTLREQDGEMVTRNRFFRDDLKRLPEFPDVTEEALGFEIHIHKEIAVAWVPYEFTVKGEFSHCGIDVFTLMKLDGSWKIMGAAYTVEKEGCEEMKGEK